MRTSLRFIKNRPADFGMIKPREFLNLFFFFFDFVFYFDCMYVFLFCFKPSGSKPTIKASMSEGRKVNRLR